MANIIIKGQQEVQLALNKFVFDLDKAVDDAVRITAFKVQLTASKSIQKTSHGGVFVKRGKKGRHEISKEGEAPNTDKGRLVSSIDVSHQKGSQVAEVGTNLDYGLFLETTHNRPWLEPAKEQEVAGFSTNMAKALDMQIKKAGK